MPWGLGRSLRKHTSAAPHLSSLEYDPSHAEHPRHKALPLLASPVDPEALKWATKKSRDKASIGGSTSVRQFEAEQQTESSLARRIFRKQHEASSLELFFDLFFVANLAVFTTRSAHMDAQSLSNYVGFFSLLWTTWFHISMYDVRFYCDSIFTRFCKFVTFGVMVALVSLGSLYDAILSGGSSRAFHGLAVLMFGTRVLWILQYGIVLYFVRIFDKTLLPMCLTMAVYACASIGFLATYIADRHTWSVSGKSGTTDVRIWYVIICLEACAIIGISMFWRILSFMHTHLVERLSLLSLIIMGEGIIGLVKSISYSIQGMNVTIWQEAFISGGGILLIYLIYILYFDNVDHHGFGTIGQQLWTLVHFPTHVAILLTVEGSTALLLWYACRTGLAWVQGLLPNLNDPKAGFADNGAFVDSISKSYNMTMAKFKYKILDDYYPYSTFTKDLAKLQKTNTTFGSTEWSNEVSTTLTKISNYYQYFVFQNFGAEGPVYRLKKEKDYGERVKLYDNGYRFVLVYYYTAAGILLLLFATLIFFGQKRKSTSNWWSIAIRVTAGLCLPLGVVVPLLKHNNSLERFRDDYAYLLIPVVALGYLTVLLVDNLAKIVSERDFPLVEGSKVSRATSIEMKHGTATEIAGGLGEPQTGYELLRTAKHTIDDLENGLQDTNQDTATITSVEAMNYSDSKAVKAGYGRVDQDENDSS